MLNICGIILCTLFALVFLLKPKYAIFMLVFSTLFQGVAAFNFGNYYLSLFNTYEIIFIFLSLIKFKNNKILLGKCEILLLLFGLYCVLLTFLAPLLFNNLYLSTNVVNEFYTHLYETDFSFSLESIYKITTAFLHIISIIIIKNFNFHLNKKDINKIIKISMYTVLIIGFWQQLLPNYFPYSIFLNNKSFFSPSKLRFYMPFLEASYCGVFLSISIMYCLLNKKIITTILLFIALILNTSSTGIFTFFVVLVIYFIYEKRKNAIYFLTLIFAIITSLFIIITLKNEFSIINRIYTMTLGKFSTASLDARATLDLLGIKVFFNTYFLGGGLSSIRTSSFFTNLIATTGIFGLFSFMGYIYNLLKKTFYNSRNSLSLFYMLIVLILGMFVSIPDINFPILWFVLFLVTAYLNTFVKGEYVR